MDKREYKLVLDLKIKEEKEVYQYMQSCEKRGYANKKEFIVKSINEQEKREELLKDIKKIVENSLEKILEEKLNGFGSFQ